MARLVRAIWRGTMLDQMARMSRAMTKRDVYVILFAVWYYSRTDRELDEVPCATLPRTLIPGVLPWRRPGLALTFRKLFSGR